MVCHAALWIVIGPDSFASVASSNLAFAVAKVMREDILKDIRSALDKALSEGKTFKEFSKELKPTLQKKGWWGEQIIVDSKGNAEKVQLGSMYRLKTIYCFCF